MFRDGYEYVLVLAVVSIALAMLGPGRFSLDHAVGIEVTGWTGGGLALGVALAATGGLLAAFWRPRPAASTASASSSASDGADADQTAG